MDEDPDWLLAQSIKVSEWLEADSLEPYQIGMLIVYPRLEGRWAIGAYYRPGMEDWVIDGFQEFARARVYQFLKNGPKEGVWFKRTVDDGWQVIMRMVPPERAPDHIPADWT